MAELERLDGAEITVGIHADEGAHEGLDETGNPAGVTVAMVGAWHEGGTRYMPARPWLAPSIDENRPEIDRLFDHSLSIALAGGDVRVSLGLVGEFAQQKVQAKIRDSDPGWAPLAESTKRAKAKLVRGSKAEGRKAKERRVEFLAGDGNPLVDTGQLIQSQRYVVNLGGIGG